MTYQIDTDIPAPKHTGLGGRTRYPLNLLAVGNSFFVSDVKHNYVRNAAHIAGKRSGKKFICKKQIENGVEGIRVWRIA